MPSRGHVRSPGLICGAAHHLPWTKWLRCTKRFGPIYTARKPRQGAGGSPRKRHDKLKEASNSTAMHRRLLINFLSKYLSSWFAAGVFQISGMNVPVWTKLLLIGRWGGGLVERFASPPPSEKSFTPVKRNPQRPCKPTPPSFVLQLARFHNIKLQLGPYRSAEEAVDSQWLNLVRRQLSSTILESY